MKRIEAKTKLEVGEPMGLQHYEFPSADFTRLIPKTGTSIYEEEIWSNALIRNRDYLVRLIEETSGKFALRKGKTIRDVFRALREYKNA